MVHVTNNRSNHIALIPSGTDFVQAASGTLSRNSAPAVLYNTAAVGAKTSLPAINPHTNGSQLGYITIHELLTHHKSANSVAVCVLHRVV